MGGAPLSITTKHLTTMQNVKDNSMMQNIWQLKIMAQLCIRLLHCKTIHIHGKSDIRFRVVQTADPDISTHHKILKWLYMWSMSSGHGDKIGGSTLCSSRTRCLVQLLKNIKSPVRRRFHLYSFLPYLIILL